MPNHHTSRQPDALEEMSDSEMWKAHREDLQARRQTRREVNTIAVLALADVGFIVQAITPYQFRVDGRLDLYPTNRRWHDTRTNERGSYKDAQATAMRRLRPGGQ